MCRYGVLLLLCVLAACDSAGEGADSFGDDGGSVAEVTATPRIRATPERVEFRDCARGEERVATVGVHNGGGVPLVIDGLRLDADAAFTISFEDRDFTSSVESREGLRLDPPVELPVDETVSIAIRYRPEHPAGGVGVLGLGSNDPDSPWTPVYLEALQPSAILDVVPARLDFGTRPAGEEARLAVTLGSIGTAPVTITRVGLADGDEGGDFTVLASEMMADGSEITPDNPLVIPANDHRSLTVTYTPDAMDPEGEGTGDEAVLLIESDDFDRVRSVPLSGRGGALR